MAEGSRTTGPLVIPSLRMTLFTPPDACKNTEGRKPMSEQNYGSGHFIMTL